MTAKEIKVKLVSDGMSFSCDEDQLEHNALNGELKMRKSKVEEEDDNSDYNYDSDNYPY